MCVAHIDLRNQTQFLATIHKTVFTEAFAWRCNAVWTMYQKALAVQTPYRRTVNKKYWHQWGTAERI